MAFPKVKILIFAFVIFLIIVNFFWQLSSFFTKNNADLQHLAYLAISWLFFLSLTLLFFLLVENRNTVFLTYILGLASFFLFFPVSISSLIGQSIPSDPQFPLEAGSLMSGVLATAFYIICLLIFMVLLIISYELIMKERRERIRLSFRKIWQRGLPLIILGLSLIISVVYYFNPLLNLEQQEIQIPAQVFGFLMKPMGGVIANVLPFYDLDMTIDEILTIGSMTGGESMPSLESISPELMEQLGSIDLENFDIGQLLKNPEIAGLIKQEMTTQTEKADPSILKSQRVELGKSLGIVIQGDETFDILMANIVNSKLKDFIGPYTKEISTGIAFALFFVLRLIGKLFSFVFIILGRIFFSLLLLLKLIQKEQVILKGEVIKI